MSAHTPGPWRASPFSSVVGCAITAQPDPKKNTQMVASTYTEADARLIAAAPDLLAAIRAILLDVDGANSIFRPSVDLARSALAKAEGKP
jgi:hypothetical protein